MATSLVSFTAMRPVLFAGTLAVAWLAFSAPSGAADTGMDSGTVLGTISAAAPVSYTASGAAGSVGSGLDTSVTAVAGSAVPAAAAPRPPAPAVAVPGPPQPVPEDPAELASIPVITLPMMNGFDPAETMVTAIEPARPVPDVASAVIDDVAVPNAALQPVTNLVTESAGQLGTVNPSPVVDVVSPVVDVVSPVVDVVSPVVDIVSPVVDVVSPVVDVVSPVVDVVSPVVDVVSPVVDVVSPVVDVVSPVVDDATVPDDVALPPVPNLVTDVAPLLVSRFGPGTVDDQTVIVLSDGSAADTGTAVGNTGPWSAGPLSSLTPCGLLTGILSTLLIPATAGPGFQAGAGAERGSSGGAMPEPMGPAVSRSGSGQASGGSQTPAAWLSNNFEYLSLPGSVPVSGPIQHVPAPVSFDPGSSPD